MKQLQFDDSMKIGIASLDAQHEELTAIINELYYAYMQGTHREVLCGLITRVNDYAHEHFELERRYMEPFVFEMPDYMAHMDEHRAFFTDAIGFLLRYLEEDTAITAEMLDFLLDWWKNHIMKRDKEMGRFLRSRGVTV
ncbi:bacteriohemerythrin [Oleidesulfovibrio sp.]|uniref:bacteriohemerythrin n=1 Tax=Oleidesulfovibrio sp. TaxID=2909707 RepID=UPI003A8AFCD7